MVEPTRLNTMSRWVRSSRTTAGEPVPRRLPSPTRVHWPGNVPSAAIRCVTMSPNAVRAKTCRTELPR